MVYKGKGNTRREGHTMIQDISDIDTGVHLSVHSRYFQTRTVHFQVSFCLVQKIQPRRYCSSLGPMTVEERDGRVLTLVVVIPVLSSSGSFPISAFVSSVAKRKILIKIRDLSSGCNFFVLFF